MTSLSVQTHVPPTDQHDGGVRACAKQNKQVVDVGNTLPMRRGESQSLAARADWSGALARRVQIGPGSGTNGEGDLGYDGRPMSAWEPGGA